jgi:hypothetical protein
MCACSIGVSYGAFNALCPTLYSELFGSQNFGSLSVVVLY